MIFNLKLIILLLIFIFGLYFYLNSYNNVELEPFTNKDDKDETKDKSVESSNPCYNMLIEKDGKFVLYNSKMPNKDGYNPLEFNNLDEYVEFVEKQKNMNKQCPVLYLQYTTDAQNKDLIVIKPSLFENNGGLNSTPVVDKNETNNMLDASLDSNPSKEVKFNNNMYSGFDQHNQSIGLETPLDKIFNESSKVSRNPIDPHWGGKQYTEKAVNRGDYKDREVYRIRNQK